MRKLVALVLVLASSTALAERPAPLVSSDGASSTPASSLALGPDLAFADPVDVNPGSGRRKLVAGWLSLALSAGNVVQAAVWCDDERGFKRLRGQPCVRTAIAFASITFLVGVPLLVAGYRQRARYMAWRDRHGLSGLSGLSLEVGGLDARPLPALSYRASF